MLLYKFLAILNVVFFSVGLSSINNLSPSPLTSSTVASTVEFSPLSQTTSNELNAPSVTWPAITLHEEISGLTQPVSITNAGDGSDRLFIVEKTGRVKIFLNSIYQGTFLDIHTKVSTVSEQGLLNITFPPNYSSKGYFYVNYTNLAGDTVVSRYQVSSDPDIADAGSETILMTIDQPYNNHNGGQMAFGLDGYLYIGLGDGGSGGDPGNRAQNPSELLGKILRIDVGDTPISAPITTAFKFYIPVVSRYGLDLPYGIPPDNPYIDLPGYRPEIWALGLRNPWRFSFDRNTNDLYIADVGQESWEEINFQPSTYSGGQNYGWRILEGNHCYNPASGCIPPADYSAPILEYAHGSNDSNGCSVTGGYVYRGSTYAPLEGIYLYGDFCTGKIWGAVNDGSWQTSLLATAPFLISTFGEDEAGNIYLADYGNGKIFMIQSN